MQRFVQVRNPSITQIPHKWSDLIQVMECLKPTLKVTKVFWRPPPQDWVSCNTDGASRGNPGRGAYGFCIRDTQGDVIVAKADDIGFVTNVEAETIAILEVVKWCHEHQVNHIIFQTDSQFVQKVSQGVWKPPWAIVEWIEHIQFMLSDKQCRFEHILR
ncbi:uncharacterized protein LOC132029492 [Lycium ferocissimum]|uniref:uncharacterized protein LOC132029492 n=1 Tax=Lycium ferocissimum TaxID=112874 RepID=UPI002816123E|nr:uncharacterized protein LOC132029492 [Lycium ferocissimum]